jgi:hypothetical protein
MSRRNSLQAKEVRRREREARKSASAGRIPSRTTAVTKEMVLSHRYLAMHDLPFSERVATVQLTPNER